VEARGLWVLSGSRKIQIEKIWIGCAKTPNTSPPLELVRLVKDVANQDAVAWEENGTLRVTETDR